jgi:hypothetical protein
VDDARPHALFETAFLGLRLDAGMRLADAHEASDDARARWRDAAQGLVAQGLLVATRDGFRVPRAERARTDGVVTLWRDAVGYTAA